MSGMSAGGLGRAGVLMGALAGVASAGEPAAFSVEVAPSPFKLDMVPIPGDEAKGIKPFWMSKTEVPWDVYDVYVFHLDDKVAAESSDVKTHPSKPYIPPDRGYGHEGFPAISVTFKNASTFCEWLSKKTGKSFRLPTEAEWEHAAAAGGKGAYFFGDDASKLGEYAWFDDNSLMKTQPVGKKKPSAWGLYDILGNAGEWTNGRDGKPTLKGGSFMHLADELTIAWRSQQTSAWNQTDPQVPKSRWWLSDGPFVGLRIVCDGARKADASKPEAPGEKKPTDKPTEKPAEKPVEKGSKQETPPAR